jgi:hypothetical protein
MGFNKYMLVGQIERVKEIIGKNRGKLKKIWYSVFPKRVYSIQSPLSMAFGEDVNL